MHVTKTTVCHEAQLHLLSALVTNQLCSNTLINTLQNKTYNDFNNNQF